MNTHTVQSPNGVDLKGAGELLGHFMPSLACSDRKGEPEVPGKRCRVFVLPTAPL